MEEEVLIESELVPDRDAQEEMGGDANPVLTDAEVEGSRLVITRRCAAANTLGSTNGIVELFCTFHPAQGMRFTAATLIITLTQPSGVRFVDVEPKSIRDSEPVRYTVDDKGKFSLKLGEVEAAGEIDLGQQREFARYHCSVRGSGSETGRAQWTFTEEPNRREGLAANQVLALTTNQVGGISGLLQVSARVSRENGGGHLAGFRDMILRPQPIERRHGFRLDIPQKRDEPHVPRFRFLELI